MGCNDSSKTFDSTITVKDNNNIDDKASVKAIEEIHIKNNETETKVNNSSELNINYNIKSSYNKHRKR